VFKGEEFIADVQYDRRTSWEYDHGTPTVQNVFLAVSPAGGITPYFGTMDKLTLHLDDGKKQDFYVSSLGGRCRPTGGLY